MENTDRIVSKDSVNLLMKFVLDFCKEQYGVFLSLAKRVKALREVLVSATVRVYYMVHYARKDIRILEESVDALAGQVVRWANALQDSNHQKEDIEGRTSNNVDIASQRAYVLDIQAKIVSAKTQV